jgi:hypothetical protein
MLICPTASVSTFCLLGVRRGVALTGVPEHLTTADLRACSVELTVLDISRGISMSVVEAQQYIPETPRLMQCCFFAGTQYCAGVYGSDAYLRLWPRLLVQPTANGREVSNHFILDRFLYIGFRFEFLFYRGREGVRMGHADEGWRPCG